MPSTKVSAVQSLVVQLQSEGGRIEQPGDDGDAGVEFGAEQQRHVVAEDVAQHATRASRDHAGDDDDRQRGIHLPGDIAAGHGEDDEPDRIQHQERRSEPVHRARNRDRQQCRNRRDRQQHRTVDPRQRIMAEQHVADGAAAKRGDASEHAHPRPIHAAPAGRERRRHRLRRERDIAQPQQHDTAHDKTPR